jgi:FkbM family methyltransferase
LKPDWRAAAATAALTLYPLRRGRRHVLRALGALLRPPFFVRSAYGPWMLFTGDATSTFAIAGTYGDVVRANTALLEPGDCFIDVGANAGLFSLLASPRVGPAGRVVAFEPNRDVYVVLNLNLAANRCRNVVTLNAAIAERPGVATMRAPAPAHSGLAHLCPPDEASSAATFPVLAFGPPQLAVLAEFCRGRRTILKVDVEGAEGVVLRTLLPALAGCPPERAIVEIDDAHLARFGESRAGLYRLMREWGYEATIVAPGVSHYDEVFVRRPVAAGAAQTARAGVRAAAGAG